jgi:hypothetical protein
MGGMGYNPDVFIEQFPLVKRFLYHLLYYRTLHEAYIRNQLQSEFWTHTIDAHLLQALINWCMVFGSDGCNPTHWKKLSLTQSHELQEGFRKGLIEHTGIKWAEWEEYWKRMTAFRDKYAAHRELDFSAPVPNFDLALKVAYYFDDWIRWIISPDSFEEPSLRESEERISKTFASLADKLLKITKESQHNSE